MQNSAPPPSWKRGGQCCATRSVPFDYFARSVAQGDRFPPAQPLQCWCEVLYSASLRCAGLGSVTLFWPVRQIEPTYRLGSWFAPEKLPPDRQSCRRLRQLLLHRRTTATPDAWPRSRHLLPQTSKDFPIVVFGIARPKQSPPSAQERVAHPQSTPRKAVEHKPGPSRPWQSTSAPRTFALARRRGRRARVPICR